MNHGQCCGNCRYLSGREETNEGSDDDPSFIGDCQRFPPSIPSDEDSLVNAVFPIVRDYDWCGEWKAAQLSESTISDDDLLTLNLSSRARKCLRRGSEYFSHPTIKSVNIISELVQLSANDVLTIKNCGETTLWEIQSKLAERGLKLKGD